MTDSDQPREVRQYNPRTDHDDEQRSERPLIPSADADQPEPANYSRDEQDDGGQGYVL